jgi:hypothetical protein
MGSMLAKAATALVLLDWHRGSVARVAVTAAVAWIAVHAYTGAIYVTVAVFTAILADPLFRRDWRTAGRNASIVAAAVALLQVPYLAHQLLNQFNDRAMAAVSGSVGQILSGSARPEFAKSLAGYVAAFRFIEVSPWRLPAVGWVLLASAAVFAVKHRRDHSLLLITLLPQATAVVGYALFLDEVDNYYYLSVMPAAVLTIVLASAAVTPPRLARGVGVALLIGALALVPARVRFADTMHRMPEYGVLVDGARKMSRLGQPMRAVRTDIKLPPTSNPEVLYVALGGRLDPTSPWIGVITSEGQIDYQYVGRREP